MRGIQMLPHGAAVRLGGFLGRLAYYAWRPRTRIALRNLERALGDEMTEAELRGIALDMYKNFGKGMIEFLRLPLLSADNLKEHVDFEGLQHLQEARARNRGIFFLSAHLGNWEMLSAVMALRGIPIRPLIKRIRNSRIDTFINGVRRSTGVKPIDKQQGAEAMLRALREKVAVGFVLDQHASEAEGISVTFFNQQVSAFKSLATLARRYKIPIVPIFIVREASGRHRVIIEPAIKPAKAATMHAAVKMDTQACMAVLERFIRRYPDQWIWLHRRWRDADSQASAA